MSCDLIKIVCVRARTELYPTRVPRGTYELYESFPVPGPPCAPVYCAPAPTRWARRVALRYRTRRDPARASGSAREPPTPRAPSETACPCDATTPLDTGGPCSDPTDPRASRPSRFASRDGSGPAGQSLSTSRRQSHSTEADTPRPRQSHSLLTLFPVPRPFVMRTKMCKMSLERPRIGEPSLDGLAIGRLWSHFVHLLLLRRPCALRPPRA